MKNIFLVLAVFLLTKCAYSQYNYGIEVEQQDAKIEGKLNLQDGEDSVIIGLEAGLNSIGTNNENVYIGNGAGKNGQNNCCNTFVGSRAGEHNLTSGNTLLGHRSGFRLSTGLDNILLGRNSGLFLQGGRSNVYLGVATGLANKFGDYNIFIGDSAGRNETGSNKLYIESTSGQNPYYDNPLIYGDFETDKLGINWDTNIPMPSTLSVEGSVTVDGTITISQTTTLENVLKLSPLDVSTILGNACNSGELFYGNDDQLYVCKAGIWRQISTN